MDPLHSVCWQTVPSEHEHDQKSKPPGSATTVHLRIEALSESLAVGEAAEFYLVAIEGRHTGRWIQLGAAPVTAGRDPQLEIVLPDSDVVQLVRGAIVAGTSECERLYASSYSKRSSSTFFAMIGSTTSRCRLIFSIRQSSCSSRTTAYPPIPRNTGLPHSPTRSSTYRLAAGD